MVYPKNCLVIDIGNEQIKIANLARGKDNVKILQHAIVPTPENSIQDGIILDKVALNNAIKLVLKEKKIKNKRVVFTISSSKIITREVDFPDLKPNKLRPIVENSAHEYFPVNLSDYCVDYVVSDSVENNGEKSLKINIIAAANSLVSEYVELADLLDLRLIGIDYAGNSLTKFINKEQLSGNKMILDMGSDSTMVSVMVDHVLKFNRNLPHGTGLLLDCIMNHFETNQSEAVRISKERPLLNIEQDNNPYLSNDVTSAMNQILGAVMRLMDYYASRNTEKIESIYIVGGGANIYGIEDYIEKYFGIPTKVIKNYKSIKGKNELSANELYFANVIGAAFSEINLVPKTIAASAKSHSNIRVSYLLVILVVVALGAWYFMLSSNIKSLEKQKARLEQDIAAAEEVQKIKTEYQELEKRLAFREEFILGTVSTSEIFMQVVETMEQEMPSDVFYLGLTDTGASLEINCVAKDKMTVAKFIETLKGMGTFSEVYVPSISEAVTEEGGSNFVTFSVSCKY